LEKADRELTKFFWYRISQDDKGNHYTTQEVVTCRFTLLPFGLICSPLLLSETVRELANFCRKEYPKAAPLINGNMVMDDFVAGVYNANGVIRIYYELTALMKTIQLPMAKWATNCEELKGI
jgi:hypothetical protein